MQEGGFETPLLPYLWVLSIAGKYRPRQGPKTETKAESRAFVSREAGVRRAGIRFVYLVRTALCQWEHGNF